MIKTERCDRNTGTLPVPERFDRAGCLLYGWPLMSKIFLLSPARCDGQRAQFLFNERARFELAMKLRTPQGASIGEIFSFLSGLYFRGKLAYANSFGKPCDGIAGSYVITTDRGLIDPATFLNLNDLRKMAGNCIDTKDAKYRKALRREMRRLMKRVPDQCEFVLLGSVASGKYVDVLLDLLGDCLKFPAEFVGRGDMSRGGLMLRCVEENRELTYVPVRGAVRHGQRPPKLQPRPGILGRAMSRDR